MIKGNVIAYIAMIVWIVNLQFLKQYSFLEKGKRTGGKFAFFEDEIVRNAGKERVAIRRGEG